MKKINISKNLIFLLILLFALTVYLFYVFFPIQAKLEEMKSQFEENRQLISTYQDVLLNKAKIEAEIVEMLKTMERGPDLSTGELFSNAINDVAKASDVVLLSVSITDDDTTIQTAVAGFNVSKYEASVSFISDKPTLLAFLKNLENSTKAAFYVDNIEVTGSSYTLRISMYCPVKQ